jgi:hypothetical protein
MRYGTVSTSCSAAAKFDIGPVMPMAGEALASLTRCKSQPGVLDQAARQLQARL